MGGLRTTWEGSLATARAVKTLPAHDRRLSPASLSFHQASHLWGLDDGSRPIHQGKQGQRKQVGTSSANTPSRSLLQPPAALSLQRNCLGVALQAPCTSCAAERRAQQLGRPAPYSVPAVSQPGCQAPACLHPPARAAARCEHSCRACKAGGIGAGKQGHLAHPAVATSARAGSQVSIPPCHVAWGGGVAPAGCLSLSAALARCLRVPPGIPVELQPVSGSLPTATVIQVEPLSPEDWEMLSLNASLLEDVIRNQVSVYLDGPSRRQHRY